MIQRFIDLLKEEFEKRLNQKTGWGKNELRLAFEEAITAALARMLD